MIMTFHTQQHDGAEYMKFFTIESISFKSSIMKNCLFILLFCFSIITSGKSQSSASSSFLNFTSFQSMTVYLDSTGKFELTLGWEKSTNKITIDAFGNRIILKDTVENKERVFVLGVKGKKYKAFETMDIVPYFACTDDNGKRCSIRLMLQDLDNLRKHPSYLYVDYADVTYVYQMFFL